MNPSSSSTGRFLLELGIVVALAAAAAIALRAPAASDRMIAQDGEGTRALRELFAAQKRQIEARGRPGDLAELRAAGLYATRPEIGIEGPVAARGDHLVALYLASPETASDETATDPKERAAFWIAYAWPRRFGRDGRWIQVIDSRGRLRYWENDLGIFDGRRRIPGAHQAPAPEGEAPYPLPRSRLGSLKHVEWRDVAVVD